MCSRGFFLENGAGIVSAHRSGRTNKYNKYETAPKCGHSDEREESPKKQKLRNCLVVEGYYLKSDTSILSHRSLGQLQRRYII